MVWVDNGRLSKVLLRRRSICRPPATVRSSKPFETSIDITHLALSRQSLSGSQALHQCDLV